MIGRDGHAADSVGMRACCLLRTFCTSDIKQFAKHAAFVYYSAQEKVVLNL